MGDDRIVRVALVQHACAVDEGADAHVDRAVDLIRHAAAQGAHLVVTQELFGLHYFPQMTDEANFALAEPIPGPTTRLLCELARELGIDLIASLFERRAAGVYHNTAVMIDAAGTIAGQYRKMHIPDDPRFYEKYYFTPGDADEAERAVWQTRRAAVGVQICWDQWFPEAARLIALRGAQVLCYPSAIGWYHGESDTERARQKAAWQTVQRSHAIANGVFVAAVNRVGVEGEVRFWGGSFIADPGGTVLAEAGEAEETVLIADCDLDLIDAQRQAWPFLRDRRVDAYGPLTRRLVD